MRASLARYFTDTLLGKLLLMLCLGIALLQGINLLILQNIQQSYIRQTMTDRINIIASRFSLMDSYTAEQRTQALTDLSRYYDDSWNVAHTFLPTISKWNNSKRDNNKRDSDKRDSDKWDSDKWDSDKVAEDAAEVNKTLQKRLTEKGLEQRTETRARIFRTYPTAIDESYLARIFMELDEKRFPLLEIAMQLSDGSWISIMQSIQFDDANVVWIQRVQLALVAVVFAALLGMILMRVTRPLRQLSLAAEQFGKHPESMQYLPEKGTRELREAAHSFNTMRQTIRDNFSERDRMLATMAHDLRTPLARMQLRIADLENEALREGFAANCSEILSIVNQGLELARSLHTTEELIALDMQAFVQSLVDDCVEDGGKISLQIRVHTSTIVNTRPICLKRCVTNLLDNALRYAGSAEVILSADNEVIMLDILDDGPGIPEEELDKVFAPYYRLESSRSRNFGGIGLGLSIANNMAHLSKAELKLQNRKAGGLQARLRFV